MRRNKAHIILFLMTAFLISCSQEKKTDWRLTFDKTSKEPYGCYIAYHLLEDIFPGTKIESGRNPFTEINRSLQSKKTGYSQQHISVIVCKNFMTDSLELDKMIRYVKLGNTIILFADNFSENIFSYFHLQSNRAYIQPTSLFSNNDSIMNQKLSIFFNHEEHHFSYSGLPVQYAFTIDSAYHDKYYFMGYSTSIDTPNSMIRSEEGGNFIICRNPVSMTNHFLLQGNNHQYAEYFFSYFITYPASVTWYSMYERSIQDNSENSLSWLLKFPPLFYSFLLLTILLLFYILFEGKRRQKNIPILSGNANTSLEFTETVGMLYYNKKDNKNLSDKMITHYLENVRSKYNLKTNELNDEFVSLLSQKTNQTFADTNAFIAYIRYIRDCESISDIDIRHLYHQLQKFI